MKSSIVFAFTTIVFFACRQQPGLDKAEIRRLTTEANNASLKGHVEKDAARITAVYTDDAVVLPPGGVQPIVGIDSIRSYYRKGLEGPGRTVDITTADLRFDVADETHATQLGTYVISYKASDTSAISQVKGEMLIVWKRIDGQWKIYLDMWH